MTKHGIPSYRKSDSLWKTDHGDAAEYELNGARINSLEFSALLSRYVTPARCPFCEKGVFDERETHGPHWFSPPVRVCTGCGYWAMGGHFTGDGGHGEWHKYLYWCAKLEEYPEASKSVPMTELRDYVLRKPDRYVEFIPGRLSCS
jgi:hypothetical protein